MLMAKKAVIEPGVVQSKSLGRATVVAPSLGVLGAAGSGRGRRSPESAIDEGHEAIEESEVTVSLTDEETLWEVDAVELEGIG